MSSRVAPAIPGLRAGAGPGRSGRGQRAGCGSGGEGRAKFGELGADLVGVGVVEVVQDRERFLPGRAGLVWVPSGVLGVAEMAERLGLAPAVVGHPVTAEGPLIAGGGFGIVAEVVVGVAETVQDRGLQLGPIGPAGPA